MGFPLFTYMIQTYEGIMIICVDMQDALSISDMDFFPIFNWYHIFCVKSIVANGLYPSDPRML